MSKSYLHEITELRKVGLTYLEIGERLGISKQRVHQIYKSYCGVVPWFNNRDAKLEELGGSCKVCGVYENLEIHHLEERWNHEKVVVLCRKHHREEESRLYRIKKREKDILNRIPIVSCPVCEKSFKPQSSKTKYCSLKCSGKMNTVRNPIRHGTRVGYGRGCRCSLCRGANSTHVVEYIKRRYRNDEEFKNRVLDYNRKYRKNRKALTNSRKI